MIETAVKKNKLMD